MFKNVLENWQDITAYCADLTEEVTAEELRAECENIPAVQSFRNGNESWESLAA
jgi:hypothetical protein